MLRIKIAESFIYASKSKYFEYESFLHVMRTLVLAGADPTLNQQRILGYIFDIFTKYQSESISKESLTNCFRIFADVADPEESLKQLDNVNKMKRDEFIQLL